MKRQLYALLILVSLALSAPAQKAQQTGDVEANLRRHIEYLASDKLEGRRTGEPGANAAAAYVSNQFAKLKLRPGATDKRGKRTYMQSYPYITGVEPAKAGNSFSLSSFEGEKLPAEVSPVGFSPNGTVTGAPVSFAGFGIVAKEANFDDYAWQGRQIDYKGDVVMVFDGNPDNDNPHSPYGRFDVRTKALIAKEHGAVGLLIISREDILQHDRLARMEYDQSLGEAAIPTLVISRDTAKNILGVPIDGLKRIEELAKNKDEGRNNNVGFRSASPRASFSIN
ncbi:MAG TPA: PA domain-containing protein, partial [Pyrinomonadaceae bacterium]|nr:PA domain-containing protein [Pyrinomonadaceae bacterium]